MTSQLPAPLASYFAGTNKFDVDAMLKAFSDTATVRDEGEDISGRADIRGWIEKTIGKYRATVEVQKVEADADRVRVGALVSGNFPGSPAVLHYNFTLDAGQITHLEIG